MDISKSFPSKYLKAADFEAGARTLTISRVEMADVGDNSGAKPVVFFSDEPKGLVLNVINSKQISKLYGGETDGWAGKTIQAFKTQTEYQGEYVDCIRLRPPGQSEPVESENPQTF